MRIILKALLFSTLVGLSLGAVAIRAQVFNPTYAILNLEHYRAYYSFYMLADKLDLFARLGALSAFLLLTSFVLSSATNLKLRQFLSSSQNGEIYSWPWQALICSSVFVLGTIWQTGTFVAIGADLVAHRWSLVHAIAFLGLAILPAVLIKLLKPAHKILKWPLIALSLSGLTMAAIGWDIAGQVSHVRFVIPPLMSTHYGPWGIVGWAVALTTSLGMAVGCVLCALSPDPDAEPDSLTPLKRGRAFKSLATLALFTLALCSSYPLYFVPKYSIGGNLAKELQCPPAEVEGRTVIFLDYHDAPHTEPRFQTRSTPQNLKKLRAWIVEAPTPNALTRPAAKILADEAIWHWNPDHALDWLEVHRRRQTYSNLNRAFLEAVAVTKSSPEKAKFLDSLLNKERFAWPGAGSRLELAAQLLRYRRDEAAKEWKDSAQALGGDNLEEPSVQLATSTITGRLLLDGQPVSGVPVALFRGKEREELLTRTRSHIEGERQLMEGNWRPSHYQYLDFARLINFYSVVRTDEEGRFFFEDVDAGLYRLAVRLSKTASLDTEHELLSVTRDEERTLGDFNLTP